MELEHFPKHLITLSTSPMTLCSLLKPEDERKDVIRGQKQQAYKRQWTVGSGWREETSVR